MQRRYATLDLRDAHHTAATVLLILGVLDRAVMEIMDWSHPAMASRCQHLTGAVRADIAVRLSGLLWERFPRPHVAALWRAGRSGPALDLMHAMNEGPAELDEEAALQPQAATFSPLRAATGPAARYN